MASIQEAADCMKLLGTYHQTGRVFCRQGRYNPANGAFDGDDDEDNFHVEHDSHQELDPLEEMLALANGSKHGGEGGSGRRPARTGSHASVAALVPPASAAPRVARQGSGPLPLLPGGDSGQAPEAAVGAAEAAAAVAVGGRVMRQGSGPLPLLPNGDLGQGAEAAASPLPPPQGNGALSPAQRDAGVVPLSYGPPPLENGSAGGTPALLMRSPQVRQFAGFRCGACMQDRDSHVALLRRCVAPALWTQAQPPAAPDPAASSPAPPPPDAPASRSTTPPPDPQRSAATAAAGGQRDPPTSPLLTLPPPTAIANGAAPRAATPEHDAQLLVIGGAAAITTAASPKLNRANGHDNHIVLYPPSSPLAVAVAADNHAAVATTASAIAAAHGADPVPSLLAAPPPPLAKFGNGLEDHEGPEQQQQQPSSPGRGAAVAAPGMLGRPSGFEPHLTNAAPMPSTIGLASASSIGNFTPTASGDGIAPAHDQNGGAGGAAAVAASASFAKRSVHFSPPSGVERQSSQGQVHTSMGSSNATMAMTAPAAFLRPSMCSTLQHVSLGCARASVAHGRRGRYHSLSMPTRGRC